MLQFLQMRILNADQMREADRRTIQDIGIASLVLMENAGRQVVAAIESLYQDLAERRIAIVCGKGNNGGDGLVVARTLQQRGFDVSVFVIGSLSEIKGDARGVGDEGSLSRHRHRHFLDHHRSPREPQAEPDAGGGEGGGDQRAVNLDRVLDHEKAVLNELHRGDQQARGRAVNQQLFQHEAPLDDATVRNDAHPQRRSDA